MAGANVAACAQASNKRKPPYLECFWFLELTENDQHRLLFRGAYGSRIISDITRYIYGSILQISIQDWRGAEENIGGIAGTEEEHESFKLRLRFLYIIWINVKSWGVRHEV